MPKFTWEEMPYGQRLRCTCGSAKLAVWHKYGEIYVMCTACFTTVNLEKIAKEATK